MGICEPRRDSNPSPLSERKKALSMVLTSGGHVCLSQRPRIRHLTAHKRVINHKSTKTFLQCLTPGKSARRVPHPGRHRLFPAVFGAGLGLQQHSFTMVKNEKLLDNTGFTVNFHICGQFNRVGSFSSSTLSLKT